MAVDGEAEVGGQGLDLGGDGVLQPGPAGTSTTTLHDVQWRWW